MTRLAIVRQKYNPAGGAERFVSRALAALSEQGDLEVSLIARKWEPLSGVTAIAVNPFYLGSVWRDWGFACLARRVWRREKFDLVQSHERIAGCDIYRAGDGVHRHWLHLRRRALSPWQRITLQLNPYHHYVKWMERRMLLHPRLKLVICNSEMVKKEIQHYFNLSDQQFAVIYNGVDTEAFHPSLREENRETMREQSQVPQEAPLLLYVGSGFERKGVERALKAIIPHRAVHLVIVGSDKHADFYKKLAIGLGLIDRVRFVGAQNDVKPFYGMADAFILPTLYDPFPNVCVEALSSGLPVFTSLQCGAAELLVNGENGWVSDALDVPAFQHNIGLWLNGVQEWPLLQEKARRTAEKLTLTEMANKMRECYQRLM
ncbi:glycosyltransferase family 4 protein [Vogesella indigofera]|uniref:glycosyltransferase family 4 protein n=1 Tax=Vogesella indigofera TaxID=45465 RepID=UPI00234EB130|nr:glycosyltransferase family 4 protein [Vogesella indigofera]MDC7698997.1 glycosyltransferase family 4 protein [Vogesella indigofera]